MKSAEPLPVGHLLDGRYRIHQVLGVGGMGRVYLANDTRLANRPVAVKEMILGDGVQELKAIEDFHREASVLARLSHPSIPQIIDYFGEQQRHYLVMEYVAGGDLQRQLDEMGTGARMGEVNVLEMARQLLDVLQFLHSQKPSIVYRDLKPANIMIDHHGRAMLIDFGIARFLPPGGRGTQIGSVGYAPPEQYLGKMEPRSDLYALAATMHHLLTGRDPQLQPPFSFPPIGDLAPEVSARTAQVIMAALDKDIAHRPGSALAMRDLLPKLPSRTPDGSDAPVANTGGKAAPANIATATVVLPRPVASSRSPTPRSLAPAPASSVPLPSPPRLLVRAAQGARDIAPAAQAHAATPVAGAFVHGEMRTGLQIPAARDSLGALSTSKTVDLGLRKPQKPGSESSLIQPDEPGKGRSRVAAALASVRAAIAAVPPTTAASAKPTLGAGEPRAPAQSHLATPQLLTKPASAAHSPNGSRAYSQPNLSIAGARLVSVTEGVQFVMVGSRLVLGRASAKGDSVDIDLSNLRRGAEQISRRHAEIIRHGSDYFVRDLGSVNGTYIAGGRRVGPDQH
jgi:hypothetical protein